jgi:hypothetical protein
MVAAYGRSSKLRRRDGPMNLVVSAWRWPVALMMAAVCVSVVPDALVGQTGAPKPQGEVKYEDFARLPALEQGKVFSGLSPEGKAKIKRARASAWLAMHRSELSEDQVDAMKGAIEFITPELYRARPTAAMRLKETAVRKRLECAVGRQRATEAFTFLAPASGRAMAEKLDDWLFWFNECIAPGK